MASADFCKSLPLSWHDDLVGGCPVGQTNRPPGVRCNAFGRASPDLPMPLPDEYRASESIASLPSGTGLVSDSCSSSPTFAQGFLPTLPHDSAVAFSLWFRSSQPTGDLHPTSTTPCPAHNRVAERVAPLGSHTTRQACSAPRRFLTGYAANSAIFDTYSSGAYP